MRETLASCSMILEQAIVLGHDPPCLAEEGLLRQS